jgi:HlyD family type I secretion membrane fusion protein
MAGSSAQRATPAAPPASPHYGASALVGYGVVLACLGGFGLWAHLMQIDSAVVAAGQVVVDGRRQVVQHLEGGIVSYLGVKEGQTVTAGDTLIDLDDMEAIANVDILQGQLDYTRAQEARLVAEVAGERQIKFPPDIQARANLPDVAKVMREQEDQLRQSTRAVDSQVAVLRSRDEILHKQIEGLLVERNSNERQLKFLEEELVGVRTLAEQGLLPQQRRLALEREKARIEGEVGRNEANEAVARDNLNEIALEISQLEERRREDDFAALSDVRQKIEDLPHRIKVMRDRVKRSQILAPKSGVVQNLRVSTLGQVVRPGDLLLEITPVNANLMLDANVIVTDVDSVAPGMRAEVRFPAFHSRDTPTMFGTIKTLSNDRLVDENTREPYFLARIEVGESDVPEAVKSRLRAGMPAEIIIPRGERTVLSYLIQPITDALRRTFREE